MKTYTGPITTLPPNGIFVFGSNTQGRHGKGAALIAKQKFGAIYGKQSGLQGQSYAIITKDLTQTRHPSISTPAIMAQIGMLYIEAKANPDKEYYVAYSGIGTNLNGYTPAEMAKMFLMFRHIPANVIFESEFAKLKP